MPGYKIVVDPGHFPGCPNKGPTGYYEFDGMWKLSNMLKTALESKGCQVILTKGEKENPNLTARGKMAKDADLFISEHSNASEGNARGVEVFYSVNRPEDEKLAATLSGAVSMIMGSPDRGAKTRASTKNPQNDYYTVIAGAVRSGCPHVLLAENGFHDNPTDEAFLKSEANLKRIADIQAVIIMEALGSTAKTSISGKSIATAAQMEAYIKSKNPVIPKSVIEMIPLYLSEGEAEGIRGDAAFAQSCLETGNFTFSGSAVSLDQNNFCGMGVTAKGMTGASFNTPAEGIRAQIHHLKAYANDEPLARTPSPDPRFHLVKRGSAAFIEWLGQKENPNGFGWATGKGYGEKILKILAGILAMPDDNKDRPSDWAREAWDWGTANKITDGTNPMASPTREQVVQMIFNFCKYSTKTRR